MLLAVACALMACPRTATEQCSDGFRCPPGLACIDIQGADSRCGPPSLVEPCRGLEDEDACEVDTTGDGLCRDGQCISIPCGNGSVDPGEVCDDGNTIPGDGCSADCRLQCGNGIVEPPEICDNRRPPVDQTCSSLPDFGMGALGCHDSCMALDDRDCIAFGWEKLNIPEDWHLLRVWAFSETNVYAVGLVGDVSDNYACFDCGAVFHFDGTAWKIVLGQHETVASPLDTPLSALSGIWANSPDDLFVTSLRGEIRHFDGDSWHDLDAGLTLDAVVNLWASGPDNIFLLADSIAMTFHPGTIHRYDGTGWSEMSVQTLLTLWDIWGDSASNLFAVGQEGTILHYNGNPQGQWTSTQTDTDAHLIDIKSMGPGRYIAVGDLGTVLTYDASASGSDVPVWTIMDSGIESSLSAVWCSGPDHCYAVGEDGNAFAYDGNSQRRWRQVPSRTVDPLTDIHASSTDNIVAVGPDGNVIVNHSRGWTPVAHPAAGEHVNDIWSIDGECLYAVAFHGVLLSADANKIWSRVSVPTDRALDAIAGQSCGRVFAAGRDGVVLLYEHGTWNILTDVSTGRRIRDVWVDDTGDAYFVTDGGSVLRYRQDGAEAAWDSWSISSDSLRALWSSPSRMFVAGSGGSVFYADRPIPPGSDKTIWVPMDIGEPFSGPIYALWGFGEEVWLAGEAGVIRHYDGNADNTWRNIETNFAYGLYALWGRSSNDLFVVGSGGYVAHYDGQSWSPVEKPTSEQLRAVWSDDGGKTILVAGSNGALHQLHR